MTFESYQKYSDYKGSRVTPDSIKQDAVSFLRKIIPVEKEEWIDSLEDQSVENKGIKFQVKVNDDIIHIYKIGSFLGQWESYLNKKKTPGHKIYSTLEDSTFTALDKFLRWAKTYDFNAAYIESLRQLKVVQSNNQMILDLFNKLDTSDKKRAIQTMIKMGIRKENVESVFKV
jgi:hypothetical protein